MLICASADLSYRPNLNTNLKQAWKTDISLLQLAAVLLPLSNEIDPFVVAKLPLAIDHKNFTIDFLVPELASSLFDNAVKMLCAQVQARATPV